MEMKLPVHWRTACFFIVCCYIMTLGMFGFVLTCGDRRAYLNGWGPPLLRVVRKWIG